MGKFNALLNLRLKQKSSQEPKMNALADKTSKGDLSSFSGVFRISSLSSEERNTLTDILESHKEEETADITNDLESLSSITSEIKAITNQAIILHGERIKKAQSILTNYKEGAFTTWLVSTYGNRQTPYNFLQYYEFYSALPQDLKLVMDKMPRQAIYTLASRSGDTERKKEIIKNYIGQPKQELLSIIRKLFPLEKEDKRASNINTQVITLLSRIKELIDHPLYSPTSKQKKVIASIFEDIETSITTIKR
jgi:hypothetical protein